MNIVNVDPFEDLLRGFFVRPAELENRQATGNIRLEIKEQPTAYQVHAELPGVKKEDIHVEIDGHTLSISAERKHEKEVKEGERILRSERYYGKVSRQIQLAHEVSEEQANATFKDGVLELVLPKKAAPQAHKLLIK